MRVRVLFTLKFCGRTAPHMVSSQMSRRTGTGVHLLIACMEVACQSLRNPAVNFPSPPGIGPSATFELGTSSFVPGKDITRVSACDGQNASPALAWIGPPSRTQSFALIVHDADGSGSGSVQWVVYDIPASATGLPEATPEREELTSGARKGVNDSGRLGYSGPCPSPGQTHRYIFKFYALDIKLPPRPRASAKYVEEAVKGHILGQAEITGIYSRPSPAPPK